MIDFELIKRKALAAYIYVDYKFILPLVSRLPVSFSYKYSTIRGPLNLAVGADWAEYAVGFKYIKNRILRSAHELLNSDHGKSLAVARYQTVSREEIDAFHIDNGDYDGIPATPSLKKYIYELSQSIGSVVLTSHSDSFLLNLKGLSYSGRPIYVLTSAIVEDQRVHPAQRDFFKFKYRAASRFLNGGKFIHTDSLSHSLIRSLEKNAIVVIAGETPGTNTSGEWIHWFGKYRLLPPGALRLANMTGSSLSAIMVEKKLIGDKIVVEWFCSPVFRQANLSTFQSVFEFMEQQIKMRPHAWWASHLLTDYINKD